MLGSDGLFDVYTNDKLVDFIRQKLVAMPLMEQVFFFYVFFSEKLLLRTLKLLL